MRITPSSLLLTLLIASASGTALAATEVQSEAGHQVIGHVTVSRASTLDEVVAGLAHKADQAGAPLFKVTAAGGKNNQTGSAVLLK